MNSSVQDQAQYPAEGAGRSESKRTKQSASNVNCRDLDRQVEDLFFHIHDRANPLHRKVFDLQKLAVVTARKGKTKGTVVVRIMDTQVLRNIVKHRVLDACENLAILERVAARARLDESSRHVITQLGVRTGLLLDDGESIDIYRLLFAMKGAERKAVGFATQ